jgi:hypothetical protein
MGLVSPAGPTIESISGPGSADAGKAGGDSVGWELLKQLGSRRPQYDAVIGDAIASLVCYEPRHSGPGERENRRGDVGPLGPSPAALPLINATMNALRAMSTNGPWFTLFSRESQKATISRFQVGLVEKDPQVEVFVSLLACLIRAQNTITQILLFKFLPIAGASRC